VALWIADGAPDISPETLRQLLADGLAGGAVIFVVPAADGGAATSGHAFLLEDGRAVALSGADASAAFEDEAPEDWAAAPARWVDAPPLEYDPDIG
jgi:hypothetical protein